MPSNFGFNLLATVQTSINNQSFEVEPWLGSGINAIGYDVDQYGPLVSYVGNIQPVDRSVYSVEGLDFSKDYIEIYSVEYIKTLSRDQNADRIHFDNAVYKALSLSKWIDADSFCVIRAVKVSDA